MKLKLSEIHPNPNNPRLIKDDKFKKLVQSLKDFPEMLEIRPIVLNKDHVILGGNMRYKAAKEAGITELPVTIVDLSLDKQREFIIKDNVSGGEWDWDLLANEWDTEELDGWGLDLPGNFGQEEVEEDEAPEVSSDPPVSKLGEIYQLGRHFVMCGDSTDFGQVSDLINGQNIDLVYTDPPYGINEKGDRSKRGGMTKGNNLPDFKDDTNQYAIDAYKIVEELGIPRQVWWGANYYCHALPLSNNWFVWDKRVEEKQHDTQSDCELAWVKSKWSSIRIFRHLWKGLMKDSERGQARVHATQKPIALAVWAFDYFKDVNIVLDLFLGSGSTLIACEQTDRICYGMELDPKYTDVIRKRYWKFVNNNDETGWEDNTPLITG
jgi:DNA modification methylase